MLVQVFVFCFSDEVFVELVTCMVRGWLDMSVGNYSHAHKCVYVC